MDKIRVTGTDLKATVHGVEYTWGGTYGSVITSLEKNVKERDIRMIGNIVFYAFVVQYTHLFKKTTHWVPQVDIDMEWIREFKNVLFGVTV